MKVKELIERLSEFDPNMEVVISDGYDAIFYAGEFVIEEFEGDLDIGVGGLRVEGDQLCT